MEPADYLDLATSFAREAGALALKMSVGIEQLTTKSSPTDVVTAADRAVEQLLRDRISAARPDDAILGEEAGSDEGSSGVRWVVDPIDGTVNYLYGIPQWSVSIGVEVDGTAVAGVVFDPVKDELWHGTLRGGSYLNGVRLACSDRTDLSQAMVSTGFGYDPARRAAQASLLPAVLPAVRDIRRFGGAALDLCAVGAGRCDAYYEQGLAPWDMCAGVLIAREAGARVEGLRGGPPLRALTLAAVPGVFDALQSLLVSLDADADPLG